MRNYFAIKLSAPAGMGIMQAGETLSKALNRLGFYTLAYPEYPSRIRGGDNNVLVVFSAEKHLAPVEKINLLLAFGKENFRKHESEGGQGFKGFEGEEIGLIKIAAKLGNSLVANTAALGFIWKGLGFNIEILEEQLKEEFEGKEEILRLNLEAARKGFEAGVSYEWRKVSRVVRAGVKKTIVNLTGNEALVEGVLKAGCGFAAIYPMTPINSILTMLSKSKVQIFRPEDEIAGIMAALGASYAGKKAMTATSGGGFSLMVEGLGMAGMAEIPIVCVVGQRTGPSTGMATYSSQADLNFVINAGQGEFPRIVLAPGDIAECFRLGQEAFFLAEKYQVPVILLTDKYLAESRFSADKEELELGEKEYKIYNNYKDYNNYKRYRLTESGISPRALPGQTVFLTNSYEHDEYGFSSDDAENRRRMMEKRGRKLVGLEEDGQEGLEKYKGSKGWEKGVTLVGWGSTKEIILSFIKNNPEFNYLHIWRPWPFPKEAVGILKKTPKIICVEGNFSGQMADIVEKFTFRKVKRVLKDDGRPFLKKELEKRLLI